MEKFDEDHDSYNRCHESLDERGNISGVSPFTLVSMFELTVLFCVALVLMDLNPPT